MIDNKTAPYAALVLRLATGAAFLAHAYLKAFVFGMAGAGKYFASLGLPDWFVYPILALEVCGGLALIAGVLVRWVAIPLLVELLATIVLVHGANGWLASAKGGGWEFPAPKEPKVPFVPEERAEKFVTTLRERLARQ